MIPNSSLFSRAFLAGMTLLAIFGAGAWYLLQRLAPEVVPQPNAPIIVVHRPIAMIKLPASENGAFAPGEKLHYDIIFKGATVGNAMFEVKDGPLVQNRATMQYVLKVQSSKFFNSFYRVNDEHTSTVDKASLYSVAFDQNLHEGRTRVVRHYTFDYQKSRFTWSDQGKRKAKNEDGPLNIPVYDVVSALYGVRARNLNPGQNLKLTIFRNGKATSVLAKISPELKELNTSLGKISCLRVEPVAQGESLFKSPDNWLAIWMTNDEKKLPVLIEANTRFGLVRIKLIGS